MSLSTCNDRPWSLCLGSRAFGDLKKAKGSLDEVDKRRNYRSVIDSLYRDKDWRCGCRKVDDGLLRWKWECVALDKEAEAQAASIARVN